MSRNPSRRNFLSAVAAAPLAAAPAVKFPAGTQFPRHERAAFCCCRDCCARRVEQGAHPLRQAVAVAFHKARAAVEVLLEMHCARYPDEGCACCAAANDVGFHLPLYGAVIEDGLTPGDAVRRAEDDAGRVIEAARAGRFPRLPRPRPGVHPAHGPAVLALRGLGDALKAQVAGHGCRGCWTCYDADGIAGGVERAAAALAACMVPA